MLRPSLDFVGLWDHPVNGDTRGKNKNFYLVQKSNGVSHKLATRERLDHLNLFNYLYIYISKHDGSVYHDKFCKVSWFGY